MAILSYGQVGWRSAAAAPAQASSLWTSVFGVWNADASNTVSVKNAWNANGNANDSKGSANGTVAAPSGTTWTPSTMTYGSGKIGSGAFTFNGSNFVSLPADTLNFTGDFSVSAWIYVPTAFGTNISRIISCFDNQTGPTTYRGWEVVYNNGTVKLQIYPSGANYYIISVPMTLKDQWVHVTAVRISGQQGEIYINGVAGTKTVSANGATSASAIAYGTSNLAYIGALYDSGASPRYSVTPAGGFKIDAMQTFNNSALDQTAVTELYNSGNGQEYPFTTSNALIASPNDAVSTNHGTLMNGCTFATGKIGKAFTFDGVNDYVQLPDNSLNFTGPFSYSFWIKASNTTDYTIIVGNVQNPRGSYSHVHGYQYWLSAGKLQTGYNNGVGISVGQTTTATIANGAWNHVVATYNPNNATTGSKVYINGTLDSQTTSLGLVNPIGYSSPMKACIGARNFNGSTLTFLSNGTSLDALSAWNKELTASEVTELYNAGTGKQYPN